MSLREDISEKIKTAMRAKEQATVSTLRLVNAAIKDKDISSRTAESREGIKDEQILALLQSMIKQRNESIRMYVQGNRPELAEKESEEINIIKSFLPEQLSEDEIKGVVDSAISSLGAETIKDMGKVMAELKSKYTGKMDFSRAGAVVKNILAG